MARLDEFGYLPGGSLLHRLDPRVKLAAMALFCIVVTGSEGRGLILISIFFFFLPALGISLRRLPARIGFLLLLSTVFLVRSFSASGPPLITLGPFSATAASLKEGGIVCWRLWVISAIGVLLTLTTRPSEMRAAVQWLLKPVPFIPEQRAAMMMGLILRFIPLVLRQARLTRDAQRARGVERRKNPLFRLTAFLKPFLRNMFLQADRMALAMESRGFSGIRTEPELKMGPLDRWTVGWSLLSAGIVLLADRLPAGWL